MVMQGHRQGMVMSPPSAAHGGGWQADSMLQIPTFSTRFLLLGWCILSLLNASASLPAASYLQGRFGLCLSPGSHTILPTRCPGTKWAGESENGAGSAPGAVTVQGLQGRNLLPGCLCLNLGWDQFGPGQTQVLGLIRKEWRLVCSGEVKSCALIAPQPREWECLEQTLLSC